MVSAPAVHADDLHAQRPGAYCPLPEPGEKPACLEPAEARYAEVFEAVDEGSFRAGDAAALEADLNSEEFGYLALSSVAWAYYQLAQRKADMPGEHPEIAAQLESWNALLSEVYSGSGRDPTFQQAVRRAAADLDARVPSSGLMAAIEAVDARLNMRAPLTRLIERIVGDSQP